MTKSKSRGKRGRNASKLQELLKKNAKNGLTKGEQNECMEILTCNVSDSRFLSYVLTADFSEALSNGHTALLYCLAQKVTEEAVLRNDEHAHSKPLKQMIQFALIHSGFLRIKHVNEPNRRFNIFDISFEMPDGNRIDRIDVLDRSNWKARFKQEVLDIRRSFFSDEYDEQTILFSPTISVKKSKYGWRDLQQAYGLGIASNAAHASVWHGHEERFVEQLDQLPEHIAAEYKLHASHWLLPHMLTRDEVNDRLAPVKEWVARVNSTKHTALSLT